MDDRGDQGAEGRTKVLRALLLWKKTSPTRDLMGPLGRIGFFWERNCSRTALPEVRRDIWIDATHQEFSEADTVDDTPEMAKLPGRRKPLSAEWLPTWKTDQVRGIHEKAWLAAKSFTAEIER